MSNADDDNFASQPTDAGRSNRRRTLLGLGVTQERIDRLSAAVTDSHAEFDAGPTDITQAHQVARNDVPGIDDSAVRNAVDRAWEEFFPDDTLGPFGVPRELSPDSRSTQPDLEPLEGLDALSLEEDSLPDPIHEPTPTLEDLDPAAVPPVSYSGDNLAITDFDAAHTEMMSNPYQSEPTVARMVCLDGPAAGQEFFASAKRSTIGRGTTNSIVVPDVSMSRQHFEIHRNPDDSFTLLDLQSINGTTLNGTKVKEADLLHGDRIEAGGSTFQFVLAGSIPPTPAHRRIIPAPESTLEASIMPRPAPPPPKRAAPSRALVMIAIAVTVLTVIAVGIAAFIAMQRPKEQPAPRIDPSAYYLAGVEAVKVQDWDRAEEQFEAVRSTDPNFEGVAAQLARIGEEREAHGYLEAARDQLDAGRIADAVDTLAKIPADSSYAQQAEALGRDARRAEVLDMYSRAQEAFAEDDLERARELAGKILERVPNHVGASDLLARATKEPDADAGVEDGGDSVGEEVAEETTPVKKRRTRPRKARRKQRLEQWGTFDLVPNERKPEKSEETKDDDVIPVF